MSKLRTFKYLAIASSVFVSGIAGGACLAESEASLQAGNEATTQSSSQNGHVGETEAGRQAQTQAGTGSTNDATRTTSSESTHDTNPGVSQRPLSTPAKPAQPTASQPAQRTQQAGGAQPGTTVAQPGGSRVTTQVRKASPAVTSGAVPHSRTTTYHWGNSRHSRVASHTHTNRAYMVQTIHQASR